MVGIVASKDYLKGCVHPLSSHSILQWAGKFRGILVDIYRLFQPVPLYRCRSVSQHVLKSFHYVEALSILEGKKQVTWEASQASLDVKVTEIIKYGRHSKDI